ncbi:arylacetamide deacetylase-like isoform X1 [Pezoporus wallicus]|uniref:arylacetamide deacetylase-like isoform X1 n=1 Tax=Pezoporus wallicus TaxID=35540 RepID=UPI00254DAE45|nr:arylacetamide deacetylase-like isoform X1 [Pezoporus wallicus]XP_061308698.1 arylacetamide deacetylase-like isoform X1 [Pezoporus flaviventris]
MGSKLLCLFLASVILAYYFYSPMPEDFEEPWKVMFISATLRTLEHLAEVAEYLGLKNYMEVLILITTAEYVMPMSDENVTVTDTEFNNITVRLYLPRKASDGLRRAVVYFHGGGWCVGQAGMKPYDRLTRRTSDMLNAVVVSVNYRLAPKYHFPIQFEDVYSVTKFFLQSSVLSQYGVDPDRVGVAGDSAGGNLAAAVAQQLLEDPEVKTKLKIQALLYPALQALDLNLPSYQENENKPILSKSLMIRFWSEYFTSDLSLREAMTSNRHVPVESSHLFQFVNWSNLLPEEMKKDHVYISPTYGSSKLVQKYPGFLDPRGSPLLASDAQLQKLPRTYILTCQHDVLRDDGFMYARRLQTAGVPVTHDHAKDAFHGAMMFVSFPAELAVGHRLFNRYIEWLNENL